MAKPLNFKTEYRSFRKHGFGRIKSYFKAREIVRTAKARQSRGHR